jgi:hypothetical protein
MSTFKDGVRLDGALGITGRLPVKEKLTRHGVRDLNHLGSKARRAEALRQEAAALDQYASNTDVKAAAALREAHRRAELAEELRKCAAAKRAEADALCRR